MSPRCTMKKTHAGAGAFLAGALIVLALSSRAVADDEAQATPANELTVRCLLMTRAESAFPPSSTRQSLEAHQLRMRTICWDWHALATGAAPDRKAKTAALLERCLAEAPFDLARAHALYYQQHVRSLEEMCRDFAALIER
jgi:hypothetical protein